MCLFTATDQWLRQPLIALDVLAKNQDTKCPFMDVIYSCSWILLINKRGKLLLFFKYLHLNEAISKENKEYLYILKYSIYANL